MSQLLRILHVASEMLPLVKTGGLADVVAALPAALAAAGHDVRVVIPGYRSAVQQAEQRGLQWLPEAMTIEVGGIDHRVGIGHLVINGVTVYLLGCNELFDRDGIYGPRGGSDYDDNPRRYALLAKAALALPGAVRFWPHIVHAHDWQAGLVPALLERGFHRSLPATRSILTIHNIAYQGSFWHFDLSLTGLDWSLFNPMQLEHWGRLNYLKAGIVFADRVTTVSQRYAEELRSPEYAFGLDAVIAQHAYKLDGITNGIDATVWDPARDAHLAKTYDAQRLAGKKACTRALRSECGLDDEPGTCLAGVVSRLVEQKGIDLLIDVVEPFLRSGRMQLVVLGSGDYHLEHRLHHLMLAYPRRVYVWYGYHEELAHRTIAGADLFLMPSRHEPCGLTQMYSMRYGTLPLVRWTGGLADTVSDVSTEHGTGFTFGPVDHGHFSACLDRALALFRDHPAAWKAAMRRAMARDFSWTLVAERYADLYRDLCIPRSR